MTEDQKNPGELTQLGAFRLLGKLGEGGMGYVYAAEDTKLRRKVALKVMLPKHAANPIAKGRFLREARAQAAVDHEHVAAIFFVGDDQDTPYIAMPLLKGQTLQAALKANPLPPANEILRIAREMAEGLEAAHAIGLIHRDIKPANVWLEGNKRKVKILDFGLARAVAGAEVDVDESEGPKTQQGAMLGTPAYMSPEQGRGEDLDARSDLFSLGIVMYEMATGERPFKGKDVWGILTSLAVDVPVPPSAKNPAIPEPLSAFILTLLAKSPADRPQTGAIVAEALEQIESGVKTAPVVVGVPPESVVNDPWADIDASSASQVSVGPMSATLYASESAVLAASAPEKRAKSPRSKYLIAAGLVGMLALVLGVVIIRITDGSTVDVDAKGKIAIAVPPEKKAPPPVTTPIPPPPSTPMDRLMAATTAWTVVKPFEMKSEGGAILSVRNDDSIIVSGALPPRDVFTLGFRELPATMQAIRLEVLPHDSLPQKGPGRSGIFVLTEVKAQLEGHGNPPMPRPLNIAEARADSSRRGDSMAKYAIDGNDRTGWDTPGAPHFAVFRLAEPVATPQGTVLRVALEFKHSDLNQLGCFRISVPTPDTDPQPASDPDRRAAEYVLSIGGVVKWNFQNGSTKATDLPREPFRLTGVELDKAKLTAPITDAGLVNLRDCNHLTSLDLNGATRVTAEGLAAFKDHRKLESLALHFTPVTDSGLAVFKDCDQLQSLDLWGCDQITDAGAATLSKSLKRIHLGKTKVSDAGLAVFKDFKELTALYLYDVKQITDAGLIHIKECKNLTDLGLERTQVTDAGLTHLAEMKTLTKLDFRETRVTAKGIEALSKALPSCKIIWDGGTIIAAPPAVDPSRKAAEFLLSVSDSITIEVDGKKQELKAVGELPMGPFKLVTLVRPSRAMDADLAVFKDCPDLSDINLYRCQQITDEAVTHILELKKLTWLNLTNTKLTDAGLIRLKDLKKLQFLTLDSTQVTDAGLAAVINEWPELYWLQLENLPKVTDAGLATLKDRKKLKRLRLAGTSITDTGLAHLAGLDQLTELILTKAKLTEKGVETLSKALPSCKITWDGGTIEPR